MHKITTVTIRNFRSCEELTLNLSNFTPIVGYNNAGKSNIIRALEWAAEAKPLSANDFFDPSKPVEVVCQLKGLTGEVLSNLGAHRVRIEPHVVDGELRTRTRQQHPGGVSKDVVREILLENGEWGNPNGITNAAKSIFPEVIRIEAMVDVNAELSNNKTSTTIGKLIKEIMDPIVLEQGDRISAVTNELKSLFGADGQSRSEALNQFDAMATEAIQEFFPGVVARLDAPPPDIREIFKTGKLKFSEQHGGESQWMDVQFYGHGILRASQMALIKMLASKASTAMTANVLLLIDEPELYMHPQMIASIRDALRRLSTLGYQVIFTTHSPNMIGRADINDTVMVLKNSKSTTVRKTLSECCYELKGCDGQTDNLMIDLNNSSQFLFCNRVILVEGDTEKIILPEIIELTAKRSLLLSSTALVTLSGCAGLHNTQRILNSLNIQHKSIVDLDFAFSHGTKLGIWSQDDKLYKDCLEIFKDIAAKYGINLNGNGLFQKKGSTRSPEEGYHLFATSESGKPLTSQIITMFRFHNIFIWPLGSIEYHLGMPAKGGDAIRNYRIKLLTNPIETTIHDYVGVKNAISWALDIQAERAPSEEQL